VLPAGQRLFRAVRCDDYDDDRRWIVMIEGQREHDDRNDGVDCTYLRLEDGVTLGISLSAVALVVPRFISNA
jgi:hypothetical protein